MKRAFSGGFALLAGTCLVAQAQAGVFLPRYPTKSPYCACRQAPQGQQVQQAIRPVPVQTAPPLAENIQPDAIYSQAPQRAGDQGQEVIIGAPEITPVNAPQGSLSEQGAPLEVQSDQVMGQYETASAGTGQSPENGTVKVNSKRLNFNYDLKDVGPSGVSTVDVWYTKDGKGWQKFDRGIQQAGGAVEVDDEGVYGISFVPRTGFGGGKEPPAKGENPQMWVEVDTTKPTVSLVGIQPSSGSRTLRIDWSAADKNLTRKPVVLSYSEQKDGPWTPFTVPMDNTGTYNWQIPPSTPTSFYLRVEASDQAGNIGTSETQSPIRIDLAQPNVTNIRVAPINQ